MSELFEERFHLDQEYLDKLSEDGYYQYFLHEEFLKCMKFIADWMYSVDPQLSVLEIGSGQAPLLYRLREFHEYIGVELSKKLVNECIDRETKLRESANRPLTMFINADIEHFFDTTTKTTDVLYDGNTLWYVKKDRVLPFVLNAMRRIKARYFVTCEVTDFQFPPCNTLQLMERKEFYLNIPGIPEFKRHRKIEIYRYVGRA
jgi:hypothetical protein